MSESTVPAGEGAPTKLPENAVVGEGVPTKSPESAAVVGRDALKWVKDVLEATALITLASIAVFTFSHQVAYIIATFVVTLGLIVAFFWIWYRTRKYKLLDDKVTMAIVGVAMLVTLACSVVKIYYWKTLTAPAVISDESSTAARVFNERNGLRWEKREFVFVDSKKKEQIDTGAKGYNDVRGDSVALVLSKKTWAEHLRIVQVKVLCEKIEEVPDDIAWLMVYGQRPDMPVFYDARLPEVGKEEVAVTAGETGHSIGVVPLLKDNPFAMLIVKCVSDKTVIATVRIEVEVSDNDSFTNHKLLSKPVKVLCEGKRKAIDGDTTLPAEAPVPKAPKAGEK